jgi:predicted Zn-dependent protease with MMP-like domain
MERERFEELVEKALEELPEQFRERLSNIDVEVADYPTPEDLRRGRVPRGHTLLGQYQGIPATRRGMAYNMVVPDRIIIFQGPIERTCRSEEAIVERVGHVVRHEIAHHFGIDDETLRRMGAY